MKVKYEFDYGAGEEYEGKIFAKSMDMYSCIYEFQKYLKNKAKYDETLTEVESAVYNKVRDEFINQLNEHGLEVL